MPKIDYIKTNCQQLFVFPKGILRIFKPRPPFFLKNYKDLQKNIYFSKKINIKNVNFLLHNIWIQSKNFSHSFPLYDKNLEKKLREKNLKKSLPFFKKFLNFYFQNIKFTNKFVHFYIKKIFLIQFSKFVIFSETLKWKNHSNKIKINFIFNLYCTKNLLDFNFKI